MWRYTHVTCAMCWYMINIFGAKSHTCHPWDVVHYVKKQFNSACFSGTQHATLPTWQITSSHWEIVVVGGWCCGWGMMHPTHYTAELLPQRKLMSPPCNDDTQCSVTYDVCTNSKHIGRGLLTVLCGSHTAYWGATGEKGRFSCSP